MEEETKQRKIFNGSLDDLPEQESTIVRVFFSSTFTDMTVDRNYLMKNSVARIREHCLKNGMDFQIVDFRWGVRDEASIDHSTNDIVVDEVISCKKMSRGPYFVAFLGDKYGGRSLPREIEANEYKTLLRMAMKIGCDTVLMNQWFKKDDNAEPAVYYFLPITDVLPNYDNNDPEKSALREKDRKEWENVEEKLKLYFRKAAEQAYEENRINKDQRQKYFYSVTEAEVTEGILNGENIRNKVLAYFRTFEKLNIEDEKAVRFTDLLKDRTIDVEAKDLRERLKIAKIQPLLLPDEIKKDTLMWTPNGVDPDNDDHKDYLVNLDKHFEEKMIKMLSSTMKKRTGNMFDDQLYEEILQHLHFITQKLAGFSGREEILEEIRDKMSYIHCIEQIELSDQSEENMATSDKINENDQDLDDQRSNATSSALNSFSSVPPDLENDSYFQEMKEKQKLYKEKGVIYVNGDMDQDADSDPDKNMKMEHIKKCELKEYCHPVVLYGESGTGKTALMAKIADLANSWFPRCSLIVRFLGTSVGSSSLRDVICSLIYQISKICNKTMPSSIDLGGDFLYLTQFFEALINNYNGEQTIVIVLDSIDQLSSHDRAHLMNWLPLKVPKNIHIIISMLPKMHGCLQNIRNRLIFEQQYVEVPVLPLDVSDTIITKICANVGRRVTKPQRRHLLQMFAKCGKPLYVKLLTDKATQWRSTTDVSDFKVGPSVQAAVSMFFDDLEKKHGKVVVEKTFGYLAASKEGLSYAEIEDLLSLDDETLQDTYLYHLPPDPDNIRIPSSVLSLLMKDVKDYLVLQKSGGRKVVKWYHRQFTEVSQKRYLNVTDEKTTSIHQILVDYFRGMWYEKAKPLELYKKKKALYSNSKRGVPNQPIYFELTKCNIRKLIELPHHLIKCKLFKDFRDEIASSYEWLYAKCKYVSVSAVIEDLKMARLEMDAAGEIDDTECYNDIKIVEQLLSLGFESIRKDSSHLALQILGQLGPDYNKSPSLKKLVQETKEWSESSYISLLMPTSQCLPGPDGYIQCLISARIGIYNSIKKDIYGHQMYLQESNNILIVLENEKDTRHDYISVFDMNDSGSAAYTEKIDKKGTTALTCYANDKLTVLTHTGSSYSEQLLKTETFAPISLPSIPDCITASDKFVIYSAITQINICAIGENMTSISVLHTIQMEDQILFLIISPDDKFLVVFMKDVLCVISLESYENIHTIKKEKSISFTDIPFRALVKILKNNRLIYQGMGYKDQKNMHVLDLETGKELYSVCNSEQYSATFVSVHPSEKVFAVGIGSTGIINGDIDKRWFIYSSNNGKQMSECTQEFSGSSGTTCLKLFGSDKVFAASALMCTEANYITIYYAGTLDKPIATVLPVYSLKGHNKEIVQLLLNKDETTLYSASKDCTIRVWNLGRVITEFCDKYLQSNSAIDEAKALENYRKENVTTSTTAIKISSDNKKVLLGMSDGQFTVRELSNGKEIHDHKLGGGITHLLTSKSGEEIIVIPHKDEVVILDSKTYEEKQKILVPFTVNCAAEANDVLVVGKGGMEAKGRAYNIKNGDLIKQFDLLYSLNQVAINSTGTKIVSTMFDFPLVYPLTNEDETDSMETVMSFNDTMMSGSSAVGISPDDEYAFSASTDGGIRVIKMSGQYVMRFDQKSSAVAAIFSPDSTCIVSCGFKTIYVWNLAEGKLNFKLKKHNDFVVNLKFNKSGRYLLTSSYDKQLVLWDFRRGISLAVFIAHCQLPLVDLSSDTKHAVYIPQDIADVAILKLNKILTNIIEGKHHLKITPALLGVQAMALSFSSQKVNQREASGIGCELM